MEFEQIRRSTLHFNESVRWAERSRELRLIAGRRVRPRSLNTGPPPLFAPRLLR